MPVLMSNICVAEGRVKKSPPFAGGQGSNDGLMPRDESEGVFPEKVPFRERFL